MVELLGQWWADICIDLIVWKALGSWKSRIAVVLLTPVLLCGSSSMQWCQKCNTYRLVSVNITKSIWNHVNSALKPEPSILPKKRLSKERELSADTTIPSRWASRRQRRWSANPCAARRIWPRRLSPLRRRSAWPSMPMPLGWHGWCLLGVFGVPGSFFWFGLGFGVGCLGVWRWVSVLFGLDVNFGLGLITGS